MKLSTELDAINWILSSIGEAPVNTVDGDGLLEATQARQTLAMVLREVQTTAWHFNTEKGLTLTPTTAGEIVLPPNTLRVDTSGPDKSIDVVQRGNRLYDRRNHTFHFKRPLRVDLVLLLPFEELPEVARQYVLKKASRQFQEKVFGSPNLSAFDRDDEARSLAALREAEGDTADYNMLTGLAPVLER